MKSKNRLIFLIFLIAVTLLIIGCKSTSGSPKDLLDKYFSSAIKQDYATTYSCYYAAYKKKVNEDEYVKHRKEASVLLAYKIVSLNQDDDKADAEVELTFGPSEKLNRKEPVKTTVKEEMVKEGGDWKIKVW
ncbi:MAG TPA: NTF2-like N-terminal transpeptidase domain-containing protein [Dissulfurispiraceae bacterium]|nr:NTF2-like N-terminal transpeptidase domain-containing protein [Dissulfurispiraceae bacterium]